MKQPEHEFKRSLFGGFDREAVSLFVAALAADRNRESEKCRELADKNFQLESSRSELEAEFSALRDELASAKAGLREAEARCQNFGVEFLSAVDEALSKFKADYSASLAGYLGSVDIVKNEIDRMNGAFSSITDAIEAVRSRFDELGARINSDGGEAAAGSPLPVGNTASDDPAADVAADTAVMPLAEGTTHDVSGPKQDARGILGSLKDLDENQSFAKQADELLSGVWSATSVSNGGGGLGSKDL